MAVTGKVALVALYRPSDPSLLSPEELAEEIRRKVEASSISSSWVIDRVTVLDEDGSTVKVLQTEKRNKLTVA